MFLKKTFKILLYQKIDNSTEQNRIEQIQTHKS